MQVPDRHNWCPDAVDKIHEFHSQKRNDGTKWCGRCKNFRVFDGTCIFCKERTKNLEKWKSVRSIDFTKLKQGKKQKENIQKIIAYFENSEDLQNRWVTKGLMIQKVFHPCDAQKETIGASVRGALLKDHYDVAEQDDEGPYPVGGLLMRLHANTRYKWKWQFMYSTMGDNIKG